MFFLVMGCMGFEGIALEAEGVTYMNFDQYTNEMFTGENFD